MSLRSIPWVLAAAIGVMGAAPALACEDGAHAQAAHGHGADMDACECGEEACECPDHQEKGMHGHKGQRQEHKQESRRHGMHGHGMGMGMRHGFARSAEIRYLPAMAGAASQHLILGGGPSMQVNDWFSMGWQRNMAVQLFAPGPEGFWLSPYCGVLPRIGGAVGPATVHFGTLVGAGAMLRTTSVAGAGSDFLQARLMWVAEPRVEVGWDMGTHRAALVGTYLVTPNMADLGGVTLGLQVSFKGMSAKGHGHMR